MSISKALKRLGYTGEWLEFGILTESYLLEQYEEISGSEDKNAEHYRSWAFNEYLKSKGVLSDLEIDNVFKLKDDGPDKCDLYSDRLHALLASDVLTYDQLVRLPNNHAEFSERPLQCLHSRKVILYKLKESGLNEESFELVKECDDSDVHRFVIENFPLTSLQVEWFKVNGSNKKIRNMANNIKVV